MTEKTEFKYILCSYLSKAGVAQLKEDLNLNTSYVLIYHTTEISLSEKLYEFKYILCSYLSLCLMHGCHKVINLNTSYVLIYLVSNNATVVPRPI